MCMDPATLAVISLASQGVGMVQQYQAGKAQAKYAEGQAARIEARGEQEAKDRAIKTRYDVGQARASFASSGFDVSAGSPLETQSDIRALGGVEALTLRDNAREEASSVRAGASASRSRANASLITGAGTVASSWYNFDRKGAFN